MKAFITVVLSSLLFACSTTAPITSTQDSDWNQYGFDRGSKGWNLETQEQLNSASDGQQIKVSNYQAYTAGYANGQMKYCQQDAYELGMKGEVYTGVCDSINKDFKYDYLRGYHSHTKDM
ncbi:DUF2799 domain-containing protein [Aliivibrio fischeri]|uniref:DUF2799 domain-containing protein n=1 Tax=Aliivibrio fischeri TaxID=668 RepID=UPI0007C450E4|nr:DUF2799 domain-containing protein [Aliivibrio fischeri]MUJ28745.1 DUF2799 domain-containing protein [Aliivibrio fischeri]MUK37198.1 DUF2799 domain-containing protein [Aliivibrio fischeri]MUL02619.1 DUF2799 domain-containing protein [Aliivibrio fischeri]MUL05097.1 DUF2799 domain-containing protein [Aliivibrio fischeri]MUL16143.1 DUF2799 domain-containing protein [Aliivibrio fischeri]